MKQLKQWEKWKREMMMIRNIPLSDEERFLIVKILRDEVEDNLKDHNKKVIERNKFKPNWLDMLNKNNKQIFLVENLLKKLE